MTQYLVFGHKNPDTDTIASAIAFAYYLNQKGHQAEAVALGAPNEETAFALDYFKAQAPRVIESAAGTGAHVALVDHNEASQSIDDLADSTVDYVIDHHRIGFESAQPLYYRCEPIGCTATVLYKMFGEAGIEIPAQIAGLMLSAIISDSLLFKSPTCTSEDVDAAQALAKLAGVDAQVYGLDLLKAGTNLASKSEETLLNLDAKSFDMNGHQVRIAQVNAIGFADLLARKEALLKAMQAEVEAKGYELFLLVVTDVLDSNSFGLVVGQDVSALEAAFGQKVVDQQLELPGVVSRKKQIVPPLTDSYAAR